MPGFVAITFDLAESEDVDVTQHNSVVSITPEISGLLADNGWDSSDFNKITWPIGAGSYGTGRFLVSNKTLELLSAQADETETIVSNGSEDQEINKPLKITYNGLWFDRMYMLPAVPILASMAKTGEESPQFFVVDFVDERYWWQKHPVGSWVGEGEDIGLKSVFRHGLNMRKVEDPGGFIEHTLFDAEPNNDSSDTLPWTLKDVLDVVLGEHDDEGHTGRKEFFYLRTEDDNQEPWNYSGSYDSYNDYDITDLHKTGRPFGEFLDAVCAMSGHVLVAYPNGGEDGTQPYRYDVTPIATIKPKMFRDYVKNAIISGGMLPYIQWDGNTPIEDPDLGMPANAIRSGIPQEIDVLFEKEFTDGGGNVEDNPDADPTTSHFSSVTLSIGRPSVYSRGRKISLYSSLNALHSGQEGEWENRDLCEEYAGMLSQRYYDRFRSGPADILLQGTYGNPDYQLFWIWPGAQTIEWALTDQGPTTRITGSYNHPLFGLTTSNELSQENIHASASTKVIPRTDGSLSIKSTTKYFTTGIYHGRITDYHVPDVEGDVPNAALYSAEAITDPTIAVFWDMEPTPEIIRAHDPDVINLVPVGPGGYCIIGITENTQGVNFRGDSQSQELSIVQQMNRAERYGRRSLPESQIKVVIYVFEKPWTIECLPPEEGLAGRSGFYGSLPISSSRY